MAKRKRAQLALDLRPRTRASKIAKRRGRKKVHKHDPSHATRPPIDARHPQHVVLRVSAAVGSLRRRRVYQAMRHALRSSCAPRIDYRVVHLSIQSSHVHLLVEADDQRALARGMQGFAICAAKRINKHLGRARGEVFAFRYHATALTNPTQTRNALAYVLNNWRHHGADRGSRWRVDPFATGWSFGGWRTPHGHPPMDEPLPVAFAYTWLLADGWRRSRAGPIALDEVPGPEAEPA